MRLTLLLAPVCLFVAGCVADEPGNIVASVPSQPAAASAASSTGPVLAAVAAPVQTASFQPPATAPLPTPRPDFGDRATAVATAAAVEPTIAEKTVAEPSSEQPPALSASGATLVPASAAQPNGSAFAFASPDPGARTLLAYQDAEVAEEHESDDRPLEPGPALPGQRWRAAYPNVNTDCFPEDLKKAMNLIADHFNGDVLVTSGFRNHGRRGSMHRSCRAADIRVLGVAPSRLAAFSKTVPGVNGVGTYRHTSVTHIDVRAEKFAWRY